MCLLTKITFKSVEDLFKPIEHAIVINRITAILIRYVLVEFIRSVYIITRHNITARESTVLDKIIRNHIRHIK